LFSGSRSLISAERSAGEKLENDTSIGGGKMIMGS
jgi:hypothetical protein